MALKDTKTKAQAVILEPIMDVEVVTPNDYVGNVIGDLTSRRGRLESQEARGNAIAIRAFVPLAEMFDTQPHFVPILKVEQPSSCNLTIMIRLLSPSWKKLSKRGSINPLEN